jgi:hypothetical protein
VPVALLEVSQSQPSSPPSNLLHRLCPQCVPLPSDLSNMAFD